MLKARRIDRWELASGVYTKNYTCIYFAPNKIKGNNARFWLKFFLMKNTEKRWREGAASQLPDPSAEYYTESLYRLRLYATRWVSTVVEEAYGET